MEKITLQKEIKVFGIQVKTFPIGIDEAFKKLMEMLADNFNRSYYGISFMQDNKMTYLATAIETYEGESDKYPCETYVIEKGNYLSESIVDWRNKTDCIKDVFDKIMEDKYTDKEKPAIEWYKNEQEMLCLIKAIDN